MSWRVVVIKSKSKLDYKMDYLVIRTEEKISRVHLSEISVLMIESTAVSLTAYLLSELIKKKIKVIFCDEQYNPQSELLPLYGSYDTSRKIKEQIKWGEETKKFVWSEVVRAKIIGQISNLPDDCVYEKSLLEEYITEIEAGDATNREAHAAKVYFNALFGKEFSRSDDNNINAALNYGYGIELNKFEHEEKMRFVDVLNQIIKIDDKKQHLINAIHVYSLSVFDALRENDIEKIKNPSYEL